MHTCTHAYVSMCLYTVREYLYIHVKHIHTHTHTQLQRSLVCSRSAPPLSPRTLRQDHQTFTNTPIHTFIYKHVYAYTHTYTVATKPRALTISASPLTSHTQTRSPIIRFSAKLTTEQAPITNFKLASGSTGKKNNFDFYCCGRRISDVTKI
jgi:hypothetical protein